MSIVYSASEYHLMNLFINLSKTESFTSFDLLFFDALKPFFFSAPQKKKRKEKNIKERRGFASPPSTDNCTWKSSSLSFTYSSFPRKPTNQSNYYTCLVHFFQELVTETLISSFSYPNSNLNSYPMALLYYYKFLFSTPGENYFPVWERLSIRKKYWGKRFENLRE